MELIQIGENALKVMLTKEDMKSYDIVFDMLDYKDIKNKNVYFIDNDGGIEELELKTKEIILQLKKV